MWKRSVQQKAGDREKKFILLRKTNKGRHKREAGVRSRRVKIIRAVTLVML